jgi:hypothetical protein
VDPDREQNRHLVLGVREVPEAGRQLLRGAGLLTMGKPLKTGCNAWRYQVDSVAGHQGQGAVAACSYTREGTPPEAVPWPGSTGSARRPVRSTRTTRAVSQEMLHHAPDDKHPRLRRGVASVSAAPRTGARGDPMVEPAAYSLVGSREWRPVMHSNVRLMAKVDLCRSQAIEPRNSRRLRLHVMAYRWCFHHAVVRYTSVSCPPYLL